MKFHEIIDGLLKGYIYRRKQYSCHIRYDPIEGELFVYDYDGILHHVDVKHLNFFELTCDEWQQVWPNEETNEQTVELQECNHLTSNDKRRTSNHDFGFI